MGIELIIFIVAILVGIFLYWRESNGNSFYRFVNKIVNSKDLQMDKSSKKGFIYQQAFIPRLVFVVSIVLLAALIIEFLTPISVFGSYNGISAFSSFAVGMLLGSYLANFIIKSSKVIEERSESIEDTIDSVVDKGKDFIEDMGNRDNKAIHEVNEELNKEPEDDAKSARQRLKDKGLL